MVCVAIGRCSWAMTKGFVAWVLGAWVWWPPLNKSVSNAGKGEWHRRPENPSWPDSCLRLRGTKRFSKQNLIIFTSASQPSVPLPLVSLLPLAWTAQLHSYHLLGMSAITPVAFRQSFATCARSSLFSAARSASRSRFYRPALHRSYVSETKPIQATVNIETTIKADQKAFREKTGSSPIDAVVPGLSADAMMSPQAGTLTTLSRVQM